MAEESSAIVTGYDVWGTPVHAEFCECDECECAYEAFPRRVTEETVERMLVEIWQMRLWI